MERIIITIIAILSQLSAVQAQTTAPLNQNDSTVYFMISYDIVDSVEFKRYGPRIFPLLKKYGAEVLASDTEALVFEGSAKRMNAIIRFPSRAAALNCYNDPAYKGIKQIRLNSTRNCTIVLVRHLKQ
jgi:uncharacterized protein (DUF1330 family)